MRVLVWFVVPWLAACGRIAFDASGAPGDDEPPGDCPLALVLDLRPLDQRLVDFPLLVRLGAEHVDRARLQPDARNLQFFLEGEPLAYEIEDPGDGAGAPVIAWVRVPVLGTGHPILVGYGAATSATASQPVWSDAYAAVFHLTESSGAPHDATGHYAAPSIKEHGSTPIAAAPGQVGGGRAFESMRSHAVQVAAQDLMYSAFTVSGWLYETAPTAAYHALVSREHDTGADNFFWIGDHAGNYFGEVYRSTGGLGMTSNKTAAIDQWVHLALTATSAGTSSQATLFIDGAPDVLQSVDGLPPPGTERPIVLGGDNNDGTADPKYDLLDGRLDEVRVETVARSAEWVRTDYLSMTDQLIQYQRLPVPAACEATLLTPDRAEQPPAAAAAAHSHQRRSTRTR